jgi:hypothetical protein
MIFLSTSNPLVLLRKENNNMKKIYIVAEKTLDYNDEYYSIQDGYRNRQAFTTKEEAEELAKQLDDHEKQNMEIGETSLGLRYEEYPEGLVFYQIVELEVPHE